MNSALRLHGFRSGRNALATGYLGKNGGSALRLISPTRNFVAYESKLMPNFFPNILVEPPMRIQNSSRVIAILALTSLFSVSVAGTLRGDITTISIAGIANANLQTSNTAFPSGSVVLGGIPFNIGVAGNNYYWSGGVAGTTTADVPINLTGIVGVHTLINNAWGENGPGTLASLTFNFSDATNFVKPLDGNVDIRDFYNNVFTNTINGTTTQNVFETDNDGSSGTNLYRLDKQFIDLSAFSSKTLVSMTLTDMGSDGVQRTFLSGVTVVSVPEPSSIAIFASIASGLLSRRRKRIHCAILGTNPNSHLLIQINRCTR